MARRRRACRPVGLRPVGVEILAVRAKGGPVVMDAGHGMAHGGVTQGWPDTDGGNGRFGRQGSPGSGLVYRGGTAAWIGRAAGATSGAQINCTSQGDCLSPFAQPSP